MATPGFREGTLDENGYPSWITGLDNDDDTNHTVHVVRGLAPADALQVLGARRGMSISCRLPPKRPDKGTSLPRAAIGPTDSGAVLLAGQVGPWTFIYEDAGMTQQVEDSERTWGFVPAPKMLSAAGREAATSTEGITMNTHLVYAVDGEVLIEADEEDLDPADETIPAALRAAVVAAGSFEYGDDMDYGVDPGLSMRVVCALAGLSITLDELREIPLLAAPFS